MKHSEINLQADWLALLEDEFSLPYMQSLFAFLRRERAAGTAVYPPDSLIFNAFRQTPPEAVKVVILGQDPYHNPGQAHGLSFSVARGVAPPPSLKNIFRELHDDLAVDIPAHGCLERWAQRGVLLLNSVLTVEGGRPGAHQNKGWETFTDRVVRVLNESRKPRVFLLWGAQAQKKGRAIDTDRHCVLRAPHPSPLSAYRGFLGCRHFSTANAYLTARGELPVDWSLPSTD